MQRSAFSGSCVARPGARCATDAGLVRYLGFRRLDADVIPTATANPLALAARMKRYKTGAESRRGNACATRLRITFQQHVHESNTLSSCRVHARLCRCSGVNRDLVAWGTDVIRWTLDRLPGLIPRSGLSLLHWHFASDGRSHPLPLPGWRAVPIRTGRFGRTQPACVVSGPPVLQPA